MWNRRQGFSQCLPIDLWPTVNESAILAEDAEQFKNYKLAVELYYNNETVASISERTGVPATDLPRLAQRCLTLADDGKIFGFRALILEFD